MKPAACHMIVHSDGELLVSPGRVTETRDSCCLAHWAMLQYCGVDDWAGLGWAIIACCLPYQGISCDSEEPVRPETRLNPKLCRYHPTLSGSIAP
jgi:hypothetical protein